MTLTEFKAWFDGYTENLEGAPNGKQWKRIKEQVGKIDGTPITYPVYVERYVRPWYPYIGWNAATAQGIGANIYNADSAVLGYSDAHATSGTFDATSAMYAAGKMEAGNA